MKKLGLFAVPTVAAVLGAWLLAGGDEPRVADADDLQTLRFATVERADIGTTVLATGVIRPQVGAEVEVGSRVSGVLQRLYVTVGDRIERGRLLAELDPTEFQARHEQAQAALETASAESDFARRQFERAQRLVAGEVITQMEYEDAERADRTSVARVREASATLKSADIQLGYTQIRAPIAGVVASVSTQVGETVAASFASPTFVTIIDLDRLEVWAYVDETDIGRVEVGQVGTFTVDTYGAHEFDAVVIAIQPQAEIENNVVNYIAVLEIGEAADYVLRPEMTTTVNIALADRENVVAVPNAAIGRDDGGTYVFVQTDDGPTRRSVRTGIRGRTHTETLEGIEQGEVVVLDPGATP